MKNYLLSGLFPYSRFGTKDMAEDPGPGRQLADVEIETQFNTFDFIVTLVPGRAATATTSGRRAMWATRAWWSSTTASRSRPHAESLCVENVPERAGRAGRRALGGLRVAVTRRPRNREIRMRNVSRLLVAIDFNRDGATLTAGSCLATDQAVELVKHLDAEVVLLHSIGPDWAGQRAVRAPTLREFCAVHPRSAGGPLFARSASQLRSRSATRRPGSRSCGACFAIASTSCSREGATNRVSSRWAWAASRDSSCASAPARCGS